MTWLRDLFDYTLCIPLWWFCVWSLSLCAIGMFMGFIGDKERTEK